MEENKTGIPFPADTDTDHLVSQLNPDECSAILRAINETYFIEQPRSWYHEELKANQTQLDQTVMEYLNKAETFRIEYEEKCGALFQKRFDIVSAAEEGGAAPEPYFWLLALKDNKNLKKWITEQDLMVLEYLRDIRCYTTLDPTNMESWKSCKLEFIFDPNNPYFSNNVLTKVYKSTYKNGFQVYKAEGTTINWIKDLAPESSEKKRKFSFFNFFETEKEDGENAREQHRKKIALDYHYCAKKIMLEVIPFGSTLSYNSDQKQNQMLAEELEREAAKLQEMANKLRNVSRNGKKGSRRRRD